LIPPWLIEISFFIVEYKEKPSGMSRKIPKPFSHWFGGVIAQVDENLMDMRRPQLESFAQPYPSSNISEK
jgi:hypothetical protein